jgi:two-component system, chemotaxis family, chemotaxis protein CheY
MSIAKKILVADDSATARMIVKRCLEMVGFKGSEFIEAKDGQEALEMAESASPTLIVADLNMPRRDGESLLQALKSGTSTRAIPVVIASSAVNPVKNERLMSLGAMGIIAKPVSPATLRQALGALAEG